MRMTRDCAGVVDASPESFEGRTTPHTGVWKGRDSGRECGLFHHLFRTVYRVVSFGRTSATWEAFVDFVNPSWESREKDGEVHFTRPPIS